MYFGGNNSFIAFIGFYKLTHLLRKKKKEKIFGLEMNFAIKSIFSTLSKKGRDRKFYLFYFIFLKALKNRLIGLFGNNF